jgi:hypothetical protein
LAENLGQAIVRKNGSWQLTITESQLNQLIAWSQKLRLEEGYDVLITDPTISFGAGTIRFQGTGPNDGQMDIISQVEIKNNAPQVKVVSAKLNGEPVSKLAQALWVPVETLMNETLAEIVNELPAEEGLKLQGITVTPGELTLILNKG